MGNSTPRLDLIGQKFGKLTVITYSHQDVHKNWIWFCECDCENTKYVSTANLRKGIIKSCGCLARENGPRIARLHRQLLPGISARNILLAEYKCGAKDRGYVFELSVEDFTRLTSQNCHYCGDSPSKIQKANTGNYIYNGIDRLNNSLGYTVDNCVSCCKTCNSMKSALGYSAFLAQIKKIHDNLNLCCVDPL